MLELKGVSYQVEETGSKLDILQSVDLTIEDNKMVVIPNSTVSNSALTDYNAFPTRRWPIPVSSVFVSREPI